MIRIFSQYVPIKGVLLFLLETVLIGSALLCAVRLRFWSNAALFEDYITTPVFPWQAVTMIVVLQICFCYGHLYAPQAIENRGEQVLLLGQSLGIGCFLLGIVYYAVPSLLVGRGIFLISTVLTISFVTLSRILLNGAWDFAGIAQNAVILGTGWLANEVAVELGRRRDLGTHVTGFLAEEGVAAGAAAAIGSDSPELVRTGGWPKISERALAATSTAGWPGFTSTASEALSIGTSVRTGRVLGTVSDLEPVVRRHGVSRIIVALEDRRGCLPMRQLLRLRVEGVEVEDAHTALAGLTGRVRLDGLQPSWFIFSGGFRRSMLIMGGKRVVDLVLASIGLVLSLPVMAFVAIAVWMESGFPLLYRQTRVGLRGKHFEVLKFRSMVQDAEKGRGAQWAVANDPRVTRVGRFIRKYRLDELPQFTNIIRGEMSFVGPRPERPEFVEQLRQASIYYEERHRLRPGLTGWAQVQYSYGSSIEEAVRKLEYDLFYLKTMSPLFDILIVAKTLRIIWTGHGAR